MTTEPWLVERYFDWLRDDCFSSRVERREYEGALRVLHDIPFYWTLLSDESRAGDAIAVRQYEVLQDQTDLMAADPTWLQQWSEATPSVLEVLLGMARRWTLYFEGSVPYYFGHFWKNMEFDRHPGRHLDGASLESIRIRVDDWMSRQFQPNGQGSPLPLSGNQQMMFDGMDIDMRTCDIWTQMNAYSVEHFQ